MESGTLPSFGIPWRLFRHGPSGAQVLHVRREDPDRFLGMAFRTPPSDSRGIPHVLEHCVLNGSAKYPVSDAFNELWRGSLHSYLNAATGPDRTIYYAGSPSPEDFRNILGVYFDLVFNPVLDPRRVALESFHYRPFESRGRLYAQPSGVIFSEMRGSYSDPEEVASVALQAAILPDTPYRFDPGGDPRQMHRLSYEDIRAFHSLHYTPGNCRIFLCMPEDSGEACSLVEPFLGARGDGPVPAPPLQQRWRRPRTLTAAIPGGDRRDGATVNLSWLLGEVADSEGTALLQVLEEVLLGDAGPICRALLDSGLGTDLSAESGIELELRETFLTAGLRGCRASSAPRVARLIRSELGRFADDPPAASLVDASLNALLFRYSEVVDEFPLRLFLRSLRAWAYDRSPAEWLDHAAALRRLGSSEDLPLRLSAAACDLLLGNSHRLNSVSMPTGRPAGGRITRLRQDDFDRLDRRKSELESYAAKPDEPGILGTIPRLDPALLPSHGPHPEPRTEEVEGARILLLSQPTGGIVYLEAAFDASWIDEREALLLPLLGRCIPGLPAGPLGYPEVATRLGRLSGGLECEPAASTAPSGAARPTMLLSTSAFSGRFGDLAAFIADLLVRPLDDMDRFDRVVSEMYGDARSDMVPNCDSFARLAAGAGARPVGRLYETWEGMTQTEFLEWLYDADSDSAEAVLREVEILRRKIFTRSGLTLAVSAPPEGLEGAFAAASDLVRALPGGGPRQPGEIAAGGARRTLIRWNTSVSSACVCFGAPLVAERDAALFTVGAAVLSDGILYRALRTGGGSYEVSGWHDRISGMMAVCSYRDPDPAASLACFGSAASLLSASPPSDEDVKLGILAAFSPLEKPLSLRGRLRLCLLRSLADIGPEALDGLRRNLKLVTRRDMLDEFVPRLDRALQTAGYAAFTPLRTSARSIFGEDADEVRILPRKVTGWKRK